MIHTKRQVVQIDSEVKEVPIRIKNSYRNISIPKDDVDMLKEIEKHKACEYVFPAPDGGPISPDSVLNMLYRVLKRAGLPAARFHDLRHTLATLVLQNSADIKTVSGTLGHFFASFTLNTYAHVATAVLKKAINTMGRVLNVSKTNETLNQSPRIS